MLLLPANWKIYTFAVVIGSIFGIFTVFYYILRREYSYWERKGFETHPDFIYILGHFKKLLIDRICFADFVNQLYKSTNEPFVGIYGIFRSMLLVCDSKLIQSILIKDFSYFTDRGVHCDEVNDPLSAHLFALPHQKWKHLRPKLSPAFTSGKLKAIFPSLVDRGSSLQNHLEKLCDKGELLDVREIAASNATNIIASVAFGIDVDTIKDPNNEFRVCGRKIFEPTLRNALIAFISFILPKLLSLLRIKATIKFVEKFIMSVVKQNLDYRKNNNVTRTDLFQLLIQLQNSGTVELDDRHNTVIKGDESQTALTFDQIAAQLNFFFAAGFEPWSITESFCMFELAKNQEIQQRVHQEIDDILTQRDGKITYESISEMKYLTACIDETLRKYSISSLLNRTCIKDYKIPGTDKIIEKGIEVFIPIHGLHMDEKYYNAPDKFKPERFIDNSSAGRPYYPFGDGPRSCIAKRLATMQMKVDIVLMLQKFKYDLDEHHKLNELQFHPNAFLLVPLVGIKLKVSKR